MPMTHSSPHTKMDMRMASSTSAFQVRRNLLAHALIPPAVFLRHHHHHHPHPRAKSLGYANLSSATLMRTTRHTSPYATSICAAFPCVAYALPLRLKVVTGVTPHHRFLRRHPIPIVLVHRLPIPLIHNNSAFITHSFDHVPVLLSGSCFAIKKSFIFSISAPRYLLTSS